MNSFTKIICLTIVLASTAFSAPPQTATNGTRSASEGQCTLSCNICKWVPTGMVGGACPPRYDDPCVQPDIAGNCILNTASNKCEFEFPDKAATCQAQAQECVMTCDGCHKKTNFYGIKTDLKNCPNTPYSKCITSGSVGKCFMNDGQCVATHPEGFESCLHEIGESIERGAQPASK